MRILLTLALQGLAVLSAIAVERPNVVLFLVDDMGWQDTSVPFWKEKTLANQHFRTPNMERLAKQGRKFTNAHACAVCTPSRVSIMTGLNAARHGTTNWTLRGETSGKTPRLEAPEEWKRQGLQPGPHKTLPERLRDDFGYRTIHAGKAHWGGVDTAGADPLQLGYDVNIGGHAAGAPGHYHGQQNFGKKENSVWDVPGLDIYHGTETHLTEAITTEAIKAVADAVRAEKPFFLNLAHYAVHTPLQAHPRYLANYEGKTYPGTDIKIPQAEAIYASMIEGMDASLGHVLDSLDQLGIAEDTLVLFASDNGGLSYHSRKKTPRGTGRDTHCWPLREGKGSAYDGGTRIPMIMAWAKVDRRNMHQQRNPIMSASKTNAPVLVEDFYPTILHWAAGVSQENLGVDGVDLTLAILVANPDPRPLVFHYPHQWTGKPRGGYQPHSSIRQDGWKAIYFYENSQWELYHVDQDIGETTNLATSEPAHLAKLATALRNRLMTLTAHWPTNRQTGQPEPLKLP